MGTVSHKGENTSIYTSRKGQANEHAGRKNIYEALQSIVCDNYAITVKCKKKGNNFKRLKTKTAGFYAQLTKKKA